jgi:hypothetical protein
MKKLKMTHLLVVLVATFLMISPVFAGTEHGPSQNAQTTHKASSIYTDSMSTSTSMDSDMQSETTMANKGPGFSAPEIEMAPNGDRFSHYPPGYRPDH